MDLRHDRATQAFRGFGFVTFEDPAVADTLVAAPLGTIVFEGRRLNCKPDGDAPSGGKDKFKGKGKGGSFHPDHVVDPSGEVAEKIFVGGLPNTVTIPFLDLCCWGGEFVFVCCCFL